MDKKNALSHIVRTLNSRARKHSRYFLIFLFLLIQISIYVLTLVFINSYFVIMSLIFYVSTILLIIRLINNEMDYSYKITWLIAVTIAPIFGLLCYLVFANRKFTKKEKKKMNYFYNALTLADKNNLLDSCIDYIDKEKDPDAYNIAKYISKYGGTNIYQNTQTQYFAWGDDALPIMLEELRKANHYIFIEYFIIAPGKMWDSILEILIEKAAKRVDVRVLYDDFGCLATLPKDYDLKLREYNIKASRVSPIRPFTNIRMNNRDHRKIMVIDGHTGFTGGINLADEYINEKIRYGKWKDNCIMLKGDAVYGLTTLFITEWAFVTKSKEEINYIDYAPIKYEGEVEPLKDCKGYVQAYGSIPFTYETIGLNVYEVLCMRAKKYLYISTPYLILNQNMQNAIIQAAKNGVDVRLLTPHIPDKKIVFQLTRKNYGPLLKAGAKIYEFTPGFVHEKMFIVDGVMGTVGTINLDYRSLFLHFENGVFLYKTKCLKDMEEDFLNSFKVSEEYTLEKYNKTNWFVKFFRNILNIIAPLF